MTYNAKKNLSSYIPDGDGKIFNENPSKIAYGKTIINNKSTTENLYSGKIFKGLLYLRKWTIEKLPEEIYKYTFTKRGKTMYNRLSKKNRLDVVNNPLFNNLYLDNSNFKYDNSEYKKEFTNNFLYNQLIVSILKQYFKKEKLIFINMRKKMYNFILFINGFMHKLNNFVSNIYNKNIVINIINLKYLYLNSYLLTRAILVKLRNLRKSSLYRILGKTTSMIKIKKRNPYSYDLNSPILKYINEQASSFETLNRDLFNNMTLNKDNNFSRVSEDSNSLSIFSYKQIFPKENNTFSLSLTDKNTLNSNNINKISDKNTFDLYSKNIFSNIRSLNNIQNNTVNFIKYKSVFGIKLHASGRLTKRYTASRAVNKYRFKGSLSNNYLITGSKRTVVIKNNMLGNLQFTKLNSKIRTGAFGIKGWVNTN